MYGTTLDGSVSDSESKPESTDLRLPMEIFCRNFRKSKAPVDLDGTRTTSWNTLESSDGAGEGGMNYVGVVNQQECILMMFPRACAALWRYGSSAQTACVEVRQASCAHACQGPNDGVTRLSHCTTDISRLFPNK